MRNVSSQVAHYPHLLELPEPIQQAIEEDLLNTGQGKALAGVLSTRHQLNLAKQAMAENWSVRKTEAQVRAGQGGGPSDDGGEDERDGKREVGIEVDEQRGRVLVDCWGDPSLLKNVLRKLGEL